MRFWLGADHARMTSQYGQVEWREHNESCARKTDVFSCHGSRVRWQWNKNSESNIQRSGKARSQGGLEMLTSLSELADLRPLDLGLLACRSFDKVRFYWNCANAAGQQIAFQCCYWTIKIILRASTNLKGGFKKHSPDKTIANPPFSVEHGLLLDGDFFEPQRASLQFLM